MTEKANPDHPWPPAVMVLAYQTIANHFSRAQTLKPNQN